MQYVSQSYIYGTIFLQCDTNLTLRLSYKRQTSALLAQHTHICTYIYGETMLNKAQINA